MARPPSKAKMAAWNLRDRLTMDHILHRTSVFSSVPGGKALDAETVGIIKKHFEIWFNSWVKSDLQTVLDKVLETNKKKDETRN